MSEQNNKPEKLSLKKDSETERNASEPEPKLPADPGKNQDENAGETPDFKVPSKGIPASADKKMILNSDGQPISPELESVINEFQHVSAELKIAATKNAQEQADKTPHGEPAKKTVNLSLDDQPVSQELGDIISKLTQTALENKELHAEPAPEMLNGNLAVENSPVIKTGKGTVAKRAVPTSTDEQPISFALAASISKLQNSMGLKLFHPTEPLAGKEVQIGEKAPPRPTLKTDSASGETATTPTNKESKPKKENSLSLQTRPEMERAPQKQIKGGPRRADKDRSQPEARDNAELVKGANIKLKLCPKCKTETEEENILCIECGYNFKTGRMQLTPAKKKKIRQRIEITFWGLVFALTLLIWLRPQIARSLYESTIGPYVNPVYEVYIRPYLTGEHDPELQLWILEQKPKATQQTPTKAAPLSKDDIIALERRVEAATDRKYPMLQKGDEALFTTTEAKSATAVFAGIEAGQVILELNGQQTRGPLEKLIPEIRLRVDPEYRAEYIRQKVKQLTVELQ